MQTTPEDSWKVYWAETVDRACDQCGCPEIGHLVEGSTRVVGEYCRVCGAVWADDAKDRAHIVSWLED